MSQPYDRVFNFSAGPCTLPVPVLEQAKEDLLNYKGTGMSVMEMSHRSKAYETIIAEAEQDFRTLFGVPEGYKVLFLQGGASMQFSMVPMSFLRGGKADYVITGTWGKKALEAACLEGEGIKIFDAKATNYDRVPGWSELKLTSGAEYLHFTSNETIQGVQWQTDPVLGKAPLVCDCSSDFLSRPIDVPKYGLIYACAQKNAKETGRADSGSRPQAR